MNPAKPEVVAAGAGVVPLPDWPLHSGIEVLDMHTLPHHSLSSFSIAQIKEDCRPHIRRVWVVAFLVVLGIIAWSVVTMSICLYGSEILVHAAAR